MKKFTSKAQKLGELGETIACRFLEKRDYQIIYRNYTRKWGEIDIIAKKGGIYHFVEVKSVSCENTGPRPEDQMHSRKLGRQRRIIETFLSEFAVERWQIDLACVYISIKDRTAKVKLIQDLIL